MEPRKPSYNIYKPNRDNRGAAVQFDFNPAKQAIFLEAALQVAEQSFDWGNKIVVKLDVVDLGKLLTVLDGKAAQAKLFHDPSKREGYTGSTKNNTVEFSKGQYGYYLRISQQSADRSVKTVSLSVSEDEAQVLRVLLERAVASCYGW